MGELNSSASFLFATCMTSLRAALCGTRKFEVVGSCDAVALCGFGVVKVDAALASHLD